MNIHVPKLKAFSSELFTKTISEVAADVERFLTLGIHIEHNDYSIPWSERNRHASYWPVSSRRRFLRALAREKKRPFIVVRCFKYAEKKYPGRNPILVKLVAPNRKYLQPAMGCLFLVADAARTSQSAISIYRGSSVNTFNFRGEEGLTHFDNWLEQCRTNPEFRAALRL